MMKFCCERCGGRIAVPPRHLNRLVRCPDCGNVTHPLAGDILTLHKTAVKTAKRNKPRTDRPAKPSPAATSTAAPAAATETTAKNGKPDAAPPPPDCANCGRVIGRLEKPGQWEGKTVCPTCAETLARQAQPAPAVVRVPAVRVGAVDDPPASLTSGVRKAANDVRNGLLWVLVSMGVAVGLLYLAVALIKSLGGLLTLAAVLAIVIVAAYFLYRAWLILRRKASQINQAARSIVKLR